jgi:hypothetical protein
MPTFVGRCAPNVRDLLLVAAPEIVERARQTPTGTTKPSTSIVHRPNLNELTDRPIIYPSKRRLAHFKVFRDFGGAVDGAFTHDVLLMHDRIAPLTAILCLAIQWSNLGPLIWPAIALRG